MYQRPFGSTTHPAESTKHGRLHLRPTCVHWVHPAEAVTLLTASQIIGRDAGCTTVLEGNEVSRRHAAIEVNGPVVAIRDLNSRNGVFVNAKRCSQGPLVLGDVVRCGEWIGIVSDEDAVDAFVEIAPSWYGGAALKRAIAPTREARADLPIIVAGETGTGKEGAAHAIHSFSQRRGPFVAVNCATLPMQLAESELFGHRKGAFTGAERAALGYFRSAEHGTLLLDEILELPLALQPKLLRAIEQREVVPVGETQPVPVDVRIVAASQSPLVNAVKLGQFRADLFARLNGLTIELPPLRTRREDIVPLAQIFLRESARGRPPALCHKLVELLCVYDWPMNLRELAQLMRRLLTVNGQEAVLRRSHLPADMQPREPAEEEAAANPDPKREWRRTDDEPELEQFKLALQQHQGSVARAAAAIGMHRSRAYRLLAAHPEIQPSGGRDRRNDPP
jgi:transcriptional regulator with AAA-type ATPase domain